MYRHLVSVVVTILAVVSAQDFRSNVVRYGHQGHHADGADGHWVDTWVSMPQLTEPANLPPAPFVGLPSYLSRTLNSHQ